MLALRARWRREGLSLVVVGLAMLAACAAGGVVLGRMLGGPAAREQSAADDRRVAAGRLRLLLPVDWSPAPDPPALPGFTGVERVAARLRAPRIDLVAMLLPARSPTLLPAELLERLASRRSRPSMVLFGERMRAYHYAGLRLQDVRGVVNVLAAPTSAGVATVACVATSAAAPVLELCDRLAQTVAVTGARAVALDPASAFRLRLPGVLASLDAAREAERRGVARGDAAAVTRLGTAHRSAGEDLVAVVPPARGTPMAIARQLLAEARSYTALAAALRQRRREQALRSRGHIEAADIRLSRLLLGCANPRLRLCGAQEPWPGLRGQAGYQR